MRKEAMLYHCSNLTDGEIVILIDIACMHAGNHKYTMNGMDSFIRNVTQYIRENDIIGKFGGDELVIIVRSTSDINAMMERINQVMRDNNLYGVMAVTTSRNGLENTFNKLDAKVSACKLQLELSGLKPDRNVEYVCGESWIVYC
jgi:diguanylate cyclase (GGDEF)-like protein